MFTLAHALVIPTLLIAVVLGSRRWLRRGKSRGVLTAALATLAVASVFGVRILLWVFATPCGRAGRC